MVKRHYVDFGPTLAAEKLLEKHSNNLSTETVRAIMIDNNIWTTRMKRAVRSFQPRYRRERFGELIQIDGSTRIIGLKIEALDAFVDEKDATSKLTSL